MAKFDLDRFYKELMTIIREGNERKARAFVLDHLMDLPPDFQSEILSTLFQEGLEKTVEDNRRLIKFQQIILEELKNIEKLRSQLEDQLKIEENKEKLKRFLQKKDDN